MLIVGFGAAGQRHAELLRELRPTVGLVALRRASSPDAEGTHQTVRSLDAAVALEPDLAVLAGPASMRVEAARRLSATGTALLIEKPLATEVADGELMVTATRQAGVTAAVGYNLRFLALLQRAREVLEGGALGRPLTARIEVGQDLASWRPGRDARNTVSASRELGGGALLELSHELDYARWLLGPPATVVAETSRTTEITEDVEDVAELVLTFRSGAVASVHLDLVRPHPRRRFELACTDGTLEGDLLTGRLRVCPAAGEPTIETVPGSIADTYRRQLVDVLAAVEQKTTPAVPVEDGLETLRLVAAARTAAETGERVGIDRSLPVGHER